MHAVLEQHLANVLAHAGPVVEELGEAGLAALAPHGSFETFAANNYLWKPNDASDDIWFLLAGLVQIGVDAPTKKGSAGLTTYGPGHCLGLSALDDRRHGTHATTLSEATLLRVPSETFMEEMLKNPSLVRGALSYYRQIVTRVTLIHALRDHRRARVWRLLVFRAECKLPVKQLTQHMLADEVGVSRPHVSKLLSQLKSLGLISNTGTRGADACNELSTFSLSLLPHERDEVTRILSLGGPSSARGHGLPPEEVVAALAKFRGAGTRTAS